MKKLDPIEASRIRQHHKNAYHPLFSDPMLGCEIMVDNNPVNSKVVGGVIQTKSRPIHARRRTGQELCQALVGIVTKTVGQCLYY